MLEFLISLGVCAWGIYLIFRENKRPVMRQIFCRIEVIEHAQYVELVVENGYGVDITASFDWKVVQHLKPENGLLPGAVIPGHQTVSVCKLWKTGPPHKISVDWSWVWGSAVAEHDPEAVYLLPYPETKSYTVSQGPGGKFSHQGDSYHAIDFDMPKGCAVTAARAGIVVDLESAFRSVGVNVEAGGNYVLVQHEDETVAEYFHLKTDGVKVEMGQRVEAGDLLGYSGNTGCSSGPHLHFMVFKARDGHHRESLPVRFLVADSDQPITLQEGKSYRAVWPDVVSV